MRTCMQCGKPVDNSSATIALCGSCQSGRTYVPQYVTEADVRRIVREEIARIKTGDPNIVIRPKT